LSSKFVTLFLFGGLLPNFASKYRIE